MSYAAIMGMQRSGTHFLGACMGSHPDIKYTGEIFAGEKTPTDFHDLRRKVERVSGGGFDVILLDTKYNQISRPLEFYLSRPHVKVIHLVRGDRLRHYFSGALHTWRGANPGAAPGAVPVFEWDAIEWMAQQREIDKWIKRFSHLADLTLEYEELTGMGSVHELPAWACGMICELLGVRHRRLTVDFDKEAPINILEYLEGVPAPILEDYFRIEERYL